MMIDADSIITVLGFLDRAGLTSIELACHRIHRLIVRHFSNATYSPTHLVDRRKFMLTICGPKSEDDERAEAVDTTLMERISITFHISNVVVLSRRLDQIPGWVRFQFVSDVRFPNQAVIEFLKRQCCRGESSISLVVPISRPPKFFDRLLLELRTPNLWIQLSTPSSAVDVDIDQVLNEWWTKEQYMYKNIGRHEAPVSSPSTQLAAETDGSNDENDHKKLPQTLCAQIIASRKMQLDEFKLKHGLSLDSTRFGPNLEALHEWMYLGANKSLQLLDPLGFMSFKAMRFIEEAIQRIRLSPKRPPWNRMELECRCLIDAETTNSTTVTLSSPDKALPFDEDKNEDQNGKGSDNEEKARNEEENEKSIDSEDNLEDDARKGHWLGGGWRSPWVELGGYMLFPDFAVHDGGCSYEPLHQWRGRLAFSEFGDPDDMHMVVTHSTGLYENCCKKDETSVGDHHQTKRRFCFDGTIEMNIKLPTSLPTYNRVCVNMSDGSDDECNLLEA